MNADELLIKRDLFESEERLIRKIKSELNRIDKPKRFIRTKELRMRLGGISDSQVYNLRIKGLLPYTKFGGMYLYDWEKIQKNIVDNQINK